MLLCGQDLVHVLFGKEITVSNKIFYRPSEFDGLQLNLDLPRLPELLPSDRYIDVKESGETLVEVEELNCLNTVKLRGIPGFREKVQVRQSVYRALLNANRNLPEHFALVVIDGYRTLEAQTNMYNLAYKDSELAPGFVADPNSATIVPPHRTGGAVDVTLGYKDHPLSLGTSPGSYRSESNLSALEEIDSLNLDNQLRRLLYWTMIEVGFVGIKEEWWHFSIGDQEWAIQKNLENAIFGGF